jgi:hypothetical protein
MKRNIKSILTMTIIAFICSLLIYLVDKVS